MSVGTEPYSGGLLHVGPVDCVSCKSGDAKDNGDPGEPSALLVGLASEVKGLSDGGGADQLSNTSGSTLHRQSHGPRS